MESILQSFERVPKRSFCDSVFKTWKECKREKERKENIDNSAKVASPDIYGTSFPVLKMKKKRRILY